MRGCVSYADRVTADDPRSQRSWLLRFVTLPGDIDAESRASVSSQLLTAPNVVTVARLACIPVFVWLIFGAEQRFSAALLLGGLGATDWVDGWLARRFDQHSELGKILDPTADRLMFIVGVGSMIIDRSVPIWCAIAVLVRELLVGFAALGLAALGAERFDVTWWGKAATFGLMFAFPFFLASHSTVGNPDVWSALAWITGLPSLLASWYSAAGYVPMARRALASRP